MAVAAARLRAKLAGDPDPAGPATGRVLAGFRRRSADRGRGSAANLAAIFATVSAGGRVKKTPAWSCSGGRLEGQLQSRLVIRGAWWPAKRRPAWH